MPWRKALTIPGWMDAPELEWLYQQAQRMASVVEIGTYYGRSTWALASGCRGDVVTIDNWRGEKGWDPQVLHSARGFFSREVDPHFPQLHAMTGESALIGQEFGPVDMVFIDGSHSYMSVMADLEAWQPQVRKLICGHDYSETAYPGVVQAVNGWFGRDHVARPVGFIWAVEVGA